MAEQFLNESNGVFTSAENDGTGKPVTAVYLKNNSEENPLYIKGMQGEPGPKGDKGDKGDPAVIEEKALLMKCLVTISSEVTTLEPAASCSLT